MKTDSTTSFKSNESSALLAVKHRQNARETPLVTGLLYL